MKLVARHFHRNDKRYFGNVIRIVGAATRCCAPQETRHTSGTEFRSGFIEYRFLSHRCNVLKNSPVNRKLSCTTSNEQTKIEKREEKLNSKAFLVCRMPMTYLLGECIRIHDRLGMRMQRQIELRLQRMHQMSQKFRFRFGKCFLSAVRLTRWIIVCRLPSDFEISIAIDTEMLTDTDGTSCFAPHFLLCKRRTKNESIYYFIHSKHSLNQLLSVNIRSHQHWPPAQRRNRNFSIKFYSVANVPSIDWCNTTRSIWNTILVHVCLRRSKRWLSLIHISTLFPNHSKCEWLLSAGVRMNGRLWSPKRISDNSFAANRDMCLCRHDANIVYEYPFTCEIPNSVQSQRNDNFYNGNLDWELKGTRLCWCWHWETFCNLLNWCIWK